MRVNCPHDVDLSFVVIVFYVYTFIFPHYKAALNKYLTPIIPKVTVEKNTVINLDSIRLSIITWHHVFKAVSIAIKLRKRQVSDGV